jgi:hypothetical protein
MIFGRFAVAQAEIASLKNILERTEHERDQLRMDYSRLVDMLGNVALVRGTQAKFEIDTDPYKEDDKQPNTWLTPGEEEWPATQRIEEAMSPDAN